MVRTMQMLNGNSARFMVWNPSFWAHFELDLDLFSAGMWLFLLIVHLYVGAQDSARDAERTEGQRDAGEHQDGWLHRVWWREDRDAEGRDTCGAPFVHAQER